MDVCFLPIFQDKTVRPSSSGLLPMLFTSVYCQDIAFSWKWSINEWFLKDIKAFFCHSSALLHLCGQVTQYSVHTDLYYEYLKAFHTLKMATSFLYFANSYCSIPNNMSYFIKNTSWHSDRILCIKCCLKTEPMILVSISTQLKCRIHLQCYSSIIAWVMLPYIFNTLLF